jgi:hypothetical protein
MKIKYPSLLPWFSLSACCTTLLRYISRPSASAATCCDYCQARPKKSLSVSNNCALQIAHKTCSQQRNYVAMQVSCQHKHINFLISRVPRVSRASYSRGPAGWNSTRGFTEFLQGNIATAIKRHCYLVSGRLWGHMLGDASRRRRRKGKPVPGGINGPPCSWEI